MDGTPAISDSSRPYQNANTVLQSDKQTVRVHVVLYMICSHKHVYIECTRARYTTHGVIYCYYTPFGNDDEYFACGSVTVFTRASQRGPKRYLKSKLTPIYCPYTKYQTNGLRTLTKINLNYNYAKALHNLSLDLLRRVYSPTYPKQTINLLTSYARWPLAVSLRTRRSQLFQEHSGTESIPDGNSTNANSRRSRLYK